MNTTEQTNIEVLSFYVGKVYPNDKLLPVMISNCLGTTIEAPTPSTTSAPTKPNRGGWTPERRARQQETIDKKRADKEKAERALQAKLKSEAKLKALVKPKKLSPKNVEAIVAKKVKEVREPKTVIAKHLTKEFPTSKNLASMVYYPATKILTLITKPNNKEETYEDIPKAIAVQLYESTAPGLIYKNQIQKAYTPSKVAKNAEHITIK